MKLPNITILDEADKRLHGVSKEVTFPLSKEDKQNIQDMITYLKMSQIPEYEEEYQLRAGMGLAYVQIGIPKRIFVIVEELEDETFKDYIISIVSRLIAIPMHALFYRAVFNIKSTNFSVAKLEIVFLGKAIPKFLSGIFSLIGISNKSSLLKSSSTNSLVT